MDRFFRWVIAASVFEIGLEGDVILDCEAMFLSGIMILPVQSILFIWVITVPDCPGGHIVLTVVKMLVFIVQIKALNHFSLPDCLGGVIPIII